jgi:D-serine deaminase-like pyridoxal phosphate-dependent protein
MRLADLRTPALVLDRIKLERNLAAMRERMKRLGVALRPHMKTAKSVEVARMATEGFSGAITVSTLAEADRFIAAGFDDVTYAVGISPDKLADVAELQRGAAKVNVITDDAGVARAIGRRASELNARFGVFIDVDVGYHRSGVEPESEALLEIGRALAGAANVDPLGVLTHAGHSYGARGAEAVAEIAEQERAGMVRAAERLRAAGLPCPTVSAGSTPTAVFARRLDGVNEMRPGNYMFFDLDMAGRGVCAIADIAVSVLTTVISRATGAGHVLTDAGGLALSKDLSAHGGTMPGVGYGLACDAAGAPIEGACVRSVSQEQGWIAPISPERPLDLGAFPVGRRLRVLPNHSCMTAAAYDRYYVVDGGEEIVAVWPRVNGW